MANSAIGNGTIVGGTQTFITNTDETATLPNSVLASTLTGYTSVAKQATTSGTAITFGSIPAGTKQIVIMLEEVSCSAANSMFVRIGDSGGLESSGYVSSCVGGQSANTLLAGVSSTSGFVTTDTAFWGGSANGVGTITLSLLESSSFTWSCSSSLARTTSVVSGFFSGGLKSLTAELTQLSLNVSTGTFDAGNVSIMYI